MKRIVLVEDDEPIRDIFQRIVAKNDVELVSLCHGQRILEGTLEPPDLFILDKQISGTSGLELCRFIRSNKVYERVPVIMISASPDIVVLAEEAGANEAIVKPFSIYSVREAIAKYCS